MRVHTRLLSLDFSLIFSRLISLFQVNLEQIYLKYRFRKVASASIPGIPHYYLYLNVKFSFLERIICCWIFLQPLTPNIFCLSWCTGSKVIPYTVPCLLVTKRIIQEHWHCSIFLNMSRLYYLPLNIW